MYLTHFGLAEAPFGLTPDTAFVFATRAHQEAMNTLLVAVAGGDGFIKVSGEVGTGKTLLCRRFLALLAEADNDRDVDAMGVDVGTRADAGTGTGTGTGTGVGDRTGSDAGWLTCYLPSPRLTPRDLLLVLAAEIGLVLPVRASEFRVHQAVAERLLALAREGRRVVLCIDEAQALTVRGLETLRLLSNLETEKRKLLQLVLFGQPELDDTLALSAMRQLRQRIAFSYRLGGIERSELPRYLDHRLRIAGQRDAVALFTTGAAASLHRASGGTPRLVGILAHKALLSAFGAGSRRVERRHVHAAVDDTPTARAALTGWLRWLAH